MDSCTLKCVMCGDPCRTDREQASHLADRHPNVLLDYLPNEAKFELLRARDSTGNILVITCVPHVFFQEYLFSTFFAGSDASRMQAAPAGGQGPGASPPTESERLS